LRRRDSDRLGMLFGQLPSKVKYQLLRGVTPGKRALSQSRAARRRSSSNGRRKRARSG
jgi:hypothetical protein